MIKSINFITGIKDLNTNKFSGGFKAQIYGNIALNHGTLKIGS